MRRFALIPILIVSGLSLPAPAHARPCDLVAAPNGSDRAAGTVASPLRSAQAVIERIRPGETGCLRAGRYDEEINGPYVANFHESGRPDAPIELRSYPGERAQLRGVTVVSPGADYVTIRGMDIDGRRLDTTDTPIGIQIGARATVLRDNRITNPTANCVGLGQAGWGVARGTIISGNHFVRCGRSGSEFEHAIYGQQTRSVRILDNTIVRAASFAVHLYGENDDTRVTGNVILDNGGGVMIAGHGDAVTSQALVTGNLISGSQRSHGVQSFWEGARGRGNRVVSNCLADDSVDASRGGFRASHNPVTPLDAAAASCGVAALAALAAR